jgi:stage V sporulation protein SpoVS
MSVIKASVKSQVPDIAGNQVQGIHEQKRAEIQAIGPQAFNQAVKALVLAVVRLKAEGINIAFVPEIVSEPR